MAGFKDNRVSLFRLFTILHFVEKSFLKLFGFTSVVKYVCGEEEEVAGGKRMKLNGMVEWLGCWTCNPVSRVQVLHPATQWICSRLPLVQLLGCAL